MRYLVCCLLAALYPCVLSAAPFARKPLTLVRVVGPYMLDDKGTMEVGAYALRKLREVGVRVRRFRIETIQAPCAPNSNIFDKFENVAEYNCYRIYAAKRRYRGLVHFLLPPFIDESGASWQAGLSYVCQLGAKQSVSISNGTNYRLPTGEPRLGVAKIHVAHELGHAVGANHSVGLMDPNAGAYGVQNNEADPPWSPQAIKEIRGCIKRTTIL